MTTRDILGHANIRLLAASLRVNESKSFVCPYCDGGKTKEKSLSITRVSPDTCFWKCWRVKCERFGTIRGGYVSEAVRPIQEIKEVNPYRAATELLPLGVVKLFNKWYGLEYETIQYQGWRWAKGRMCIVMPIWTFLGHRVGVVTKCISKSLVEQGVCPKTRNYWEETSVPVCWPKLPDPENTSVWVVEDIISATRIKQMGHDAVAILGSHMTQQMAAHLRHVGKERVYLALDADTWGTNHEVPKPIAFQKAYHLMFDMIKPVRLEADPKDMPEEDLRELLNLEHAA